MKAYRVLVRPLVTSSAPRNHYQVSHQVAHVVKNSSKELKVVSSSLMSISPLLKTNTPNRKVKALSEVFHLQAGGVVGKLGLGTARVLCSNPKERVLWTLLRLGILFQSEQNTETY